MTYDSVDLCCTWEVSLGKEPGEGSGDPPSFLPPVRMGCGPSDTAVHKSKGCDAGVVREKTIAQILTQKNCGG